MSALTIDTQGSQLVLLPHSKQLAMGPLNSSIMPQSQHQAPNHATISEIVATPVPRNLLNVSGGGASSGGGNMEDLRRSAGELLQQSLHVHQMHVHSTSVFHQFLRHVSALLSPHNHHLVLQLFSVCRSVHDAARISQAESGVICE